MGSAHLIETPYAIGPRYRRGVGFCGSLGGIKTFLRGEHFQVKNMVDVVRKKVKAVGLLGVGLFPCFYMIDTFPLGVWLFLPGR